MKVYLRLLAVLYFVGAILHLADIFDLRLQLSQMDTVWKIWIWYLFVFDLLASIGLWRNRFWGQILFILIAISQLVAYLGFQKIFGSQTELIVFHCTTLFLYGFFLLSRPKQRSI